MQWAPEARPNAEQCSVSMTPSAIPTSPWRASSQGRNMPLSAFGDKAAKPTGEGIAATDMAHPRDGQGRD